MTPYWTDGQVTLHLGDCLDVLAGMEPASVDAIVTDPPAAIGFMGREWDSNRGGRDQWIAWLAARLQEACRVLKPGGHALVWALPRTAGWTQIALEDAGFEVRDCIPHIYGSGFPKSHSVHKATLNLVELRYAEARCHCLDTRDGCATRHDAGQGSSGQIRDGRPASPIPAPQTEHPGLSSEPGARNGAVRELRHGNGTQTPGPAPVSAPVLLQGLCGCGSEEAGLGHAEVRAGLEEHSGASAAARQDVPGLRQDPRGERERAACAPLGALPVRGDEPDGQPDSAVRFLPSHSGSGNGLSAVRDPSRGQPRELHPDDHPGWGPAVAQVCSWCGFPDPDWLASLVPLGTALKPGQELWWLARKPLRGTVAATVLEHGTGALNIARCRVGPDVDTRRSKGRDPSASSAFPHSDDAWVPHLTEAGTETGGRWPPNLVLTHSAACEVIGTRLIRGDSRSGQEPGERPGGFGDVGAASGSERPNGALHGDQVAEVFACAPDCPVAELDRQSGVLTSGANPARRGSDKLRDAYGEFAGQKDCTPHRGADSGGASRFYPVFRYQAKAPSGERPRGEDGSAHPTVKALSLMQWLCRLITPPGGTVLDLFAGSGPTAEACIIEGFQCILVERDPASAELIRIRLRKDIQPAMFGDVS